MYEHHNYQSANLTGILYVVINLWAPFSEALLKNRFFMRASKHKKLSILMHVVGSRGDVAPFLRIVEVLKEIEHRVRTATHSRFCNIVLTAVIEFYPIVADPETLMS